MSRLTHSNLRQMPREWPRCIHLAGADGTGKTTQARLILALLCKQGIRARYAWLRFPRLFCTPFLIYARLRGYSHQEVVDGCRYGMWDFRASWLMANVFPWALLLDAFLIAMVRIYIPLWLGYTPVCDRFVVDILTDLVTGLGDLRFDERIPGRLFLALLPRDSAVAVLDLAPNIAQQRCPELKGDRSQPLRRAVYLDIARRHGIAVISTEDSIASTTAQLIDVMARRGASEQTE